MVGYHNLLTWQQNLRLLQARNQIPGELRGRGGTDSWTWALGMSGVVRASVGPGHTEAYLLYTQCSAQPGTCPSAPDTAAFFPQLRRSPHCTATALGGTFSPWDSLLLSVA